jgi:hypothetical protein
MAKRFSETVNIQQVDTRTGVTQAASSLSDRLSQFSSQLAQKTAAVSQQRSAERGAVSGGGVQLRDEQGQLTTPEFKEKPQFIGGIEVAAHNKALRARYLSELNNDNRVSVSEIVANNPDNLLNFNDAANGYRDGVLKGVEPSVRGAVSEDLNNMITSARIRVQSAAIQKQRRENIEGLALAGEGFFDSAENLTRNGENLEAGEAMLEGIKVVDAMVEAGYITEAQGQQRKDDANQELSEQSFRLELDNITENEGFQAAFARLDEMDGRPPKGFTPDKWDTFIASAQADVNQARVREAQLQTKVNIEQEREISNLKIKANTGTGDPSEIVKQTEDFFDRGLINEGERTSIFTSMINGQNKSRKTALDMSAVSKRLAGNNAVVVDDKIADKYYSDVIAPSFEGMTQTQIDGEKVNYVNRMKRIPKAMKDEVNTFVMSGDPVLIREGMALMDKIDDVPGVIEDTFSNQQKAFAQTVLDLSANMEPAEAVALATQLTDPTNKARIEAVEAEIKESKTGFRAINYRDIVDNHFDPIFGSTRVGDIAGDQLAKEYEQQYEALLKSGMNEGSAKDKTLQLIERNWKESDVTGRVMKYRPDDYYSVNGSVDYIRDQLAEEVNRVGGFAEEIPAGRMFIQATEATARAASGNLPAYRIVILDESGNMAPFYGQDGKGLWFPDVQKEIDRVEAENRKAAGEKVKGTTKFTKRREAFRKGAFGSDKEVRSAPPELTDSEKADLPVHPSLAEEPLSDDDKKLIEVLKREAK